MHRNPTSNCSESWIPSVNEAAWETLISALNLRPHPEGGYYREVYRSPHEVGFQASHRSAGTSIHYLLANGACSSWHRIDADEIWYFHTGSPLMLHILQPDGELATHQLADPLRHPGS
ncbi:MAG: cupin domain-containing protein, partial [Burkholderiaceae bacterium]